MSHLAFEGRKLKVMTAHDDLLAVPEPRTDSLKLCLWLPRKDCTHQRGMGLVEAIGRKTILSRVAKRVSPESTGSQR